MHSRVFDCTLYKPLQAITLPRPPGRLEGLTLTLAISLHEPEHDGTLVSLCLAFSANTTKVVVVVG